MRYYSNSADFYGMFEADTFDVEQHNGRVFSGYIYNNAGEQLLVAEFTHYNDEADGEGEGWYNSDLI